MGTVQYDGTNYTVYGPSSGTFTQAGDYLKASVGPGPDAWNALDDDNKARFIIEAFRMLERQKWDETTAGTFAVRNAIAAVVEGAPLLFAQAQYELAALLAADASIKTAATTGSNVKRVNAKGVEVEFFRATDGLATAKKMPASILDLVGEYLASSSASSGVTAFNTRSGSFNDCERSSFDDCASFDRDEPF
jgi:hypothetical protein